MTNAAWGFGLATLDSDGVVLDVWFPAPALGSPGDETAPAELVALATPDPLREVTREVRLVTILDLSAPPASTEAAWLRRVMRLSPRRRSRLARRRPSACRSAPSSPPAGRARRPPGRGA